MLDPKVFKAYDVRGIYPGELDERRRVRDRPRLRAAVRAAAHRGRAGHAALEPGDGRELMRGAADEGADVLDLGLVGTEMVYFAVGELGLDGGVMVTASHNPKEYTGMKIVRRGALPVGGESGLLDVRDRALALGATCRRRRRRARSRSTTSGRSTSTGCCRSSTCRRCGR